MALQCKSPMLRASENSSNPDYTCRWSRALALATTGKRIQAPMAIVILFGLAEEFNRAQHAGCYRRLYLKLTQKKETNWLNRVAREQSAHKAARFSSS
jgi:hypothetical protein